MTDNDETGSIPPGNWMACPFGGRAHFGNAIWLPPKPPLKSLEEHNAERRAAYQAASAPRPNGIACPECGTELLDSNPMVVLTTNPAKIQVRCQFCDYYGERLA